MSVIDTNGLQEIVDSIKNYINNKDDKIQTQIDNLVINSSGDSNAEVVQSRSSYSTLNGRLNNYDDVLGIINTGSNIVTTEEVVTEEVVTEEYLKSNSNNGDNYTLSENGVVSATNTLSYTEDIIIFNDSKMSFTLDRSLYWIILGGTYEGYSVLGIATNEANQNFTGQMADFVNSSMTIRYNAANFNAVNNAKVGDTVIVNNKSDSVVVTYKKAGSSVENNWFTITKSSYQNARYINETKIGFVFGISASETTATAVNARSMFSNLTKITEKQETITAPVNRLDRLESAIIDLGGKIPDVPSNDSNTTIKEKKQAIVVVAGQSNAVGYDESPVTRLFNGKKDPRVKQLGFYDDNNLKIIPLGHCAENFQDMRSFTNPSSQGGLTGTKGIHLPLGKLIAKELPDDYEVLIIPCAYGGTAFSTGTTGTYDSTTMKPSSGILKWGTTSPLYLAMRDRLKYALDLNEDNIFLGVVWIQGENDNSNPTTHYSGFQQMTEAFFTYFNNGYTDRIKKGTFDKDCWFNVESTKYWMTMSGCSTIWNNYKAWNENTYVSIPTDTDTNETNGTGKTSSTLTAHFGNDSFTNVIAPLVFEKLKNNI